MYVQTVVNLLAQAVAAIGVGGAFNAAKIALYRSPALPGRRKALADFDITDIGGATNIKSIAWGAPFVNVNEQAEVQGGLVSWLTTLAPVPAISIAGYVILNTAGDTVLLAEAFPQLVTFDKLGQNFSLVPRLTFDT